MIIDKTARQKGAPSWLKELIYVDDAKNAAKPAREGAAGSEGGTRSDSLLKANATHPTTCDGGPKGIATYPSNSEGNVLNEPAETGEKNFDTCNDELEIAAESECDLVFFSLRRIAEKTSSAVAKTLEPEPTGRLRSWRRIHWPTESPRQHPGARAGPLRGRRTSHPIPFAWQWPAARPAPACRRKASGRRPSQP